MRVLNVQGYTLCKMQWCEWRGEGWTIGKKITNETIEEKRENCIKRGKKGLKMVSFWVKIIEF